jgi:hypothetical protein
MFNPFNILVAVAVVAVAVAVGLFLVWRNNKVKFVAVMAVLDELISGKVDEAAVKAAVEKIKEILGKK